jgi:hypothetical protein
MNGQLIVGLVINAIENYVARRTEAGATISDEEAALFALNYSVVFRAMLETEIGKEIGG